MNGFLLYLLVDDSRSVSGENFTISESSQVRRLHKAFRVEYIITTKIKLGCSCEIYTSVLKFRQSKNLRRR